MKKFFNILILLSIFSCQGKNDQSNHFTSALNNSTQKQDTATLAGGCFWCMEASFEQIEGVSEVISGYAGGKAETAKYKLVGSGTTDHAETIQIIFDPNVISYEVLLKIFFTAHDPTQLNRQGPDIGSQYRSAIFYHNQEQLDVAEKVIKATQSDFDNKIVTELNRYTKFYQGEYYHQDFEKNNPFNPYILNVSKPKIDRVKIKFEDLLKKDND